MDNQVRYATFGERISAFIYDTLYKLWVPIVFYVLIVILQFILLLGADEAEKDSLYTILSTIQMVVPILLILLGQPLYAMFGEMSKRHTSKGKFKKNMYVLNKNNQFLTKGQSFGRMILKYLTAYFFLISMITMCCTKKKQTLYDLILGQVVVKKIS